MAGFRLNIPESERELVKSFLGLPAEKREQLTAAMETPLKQLSVKALLENVPDDLAPFVKMLASLELTRRRKQVSSPEFAEEFDRYVRALFTEGVSIDAFESAKETLTRLLGDATGVGIVTHAAEVVHQGRQVFQRVRIVSDLRPIFGSDPATPMAAAVVHEVCISHDGSDADVYVLMSRTHLTEFRDAIDRALKKEAALHELMQKLELRAYVEEI